MDATQFLPMLGSYDSVADRKLGASETDERTLAHLIIDQVTRSPSVQYCVGMCRGM